MNLGIYFKPSADSGGTNSNLEVLPDPNAESGESARGVVVADANKEVAILSGTITIRECCSTLYVGLAHTPIQTSS